MQLVALMVLVAGSTLQNAGGAELQGQFQVVSQTYVGYAQFSVSFNASRVAFVGSNLTVTAMVSVDNLTGAENYVRDYVLVAVVLCNDHSVNESFGSPIPTQRFLYAGALWGPLNFSFPLTQADTGLSPGQHANASLTLRLIADVSYDYVGYRESEYSPVFGDGGAVVEVTDPGGPASNVPVTAVSSTLLLPSFLFVGGMAFLATAILARERHRDKAT